jgi:hypothetical protein
MAFNVYDMLSTINSLGGLSKASQFYVNLTPPPSLNNLVDENFWMLCEAAQLPGINFQTEDFKQWGYGNSEKRPHGVSFQDMQLTFLNDNSGAIMSLLHQWVQSVYNFDDSDNPNGQSVDLMINNFAYPEEFYGSIDIIHLNPISDYEDSEENTVVKYTLNKAYPTNIPDVNIAWDMTDQIVRLHANFSYKSWTSTTLAASEVTYLTQSRMNSIGTTQVIVDSPINFVNSLVITE